MYLVLKILFSFFIKNKLISFLILISGILLSITETYGISRTVASIIATAQSKKFTEMDFLLKLFCFLFTLYTFLNFVYELLKNKLIVKIRYWIRNELIRILMKSNNENFSDKNFIRLNSPISRISNTAFFFMNDLFTYLIPNLIFILVVFGYFTYKDPKMGITFILVNICLLIYLILQMPIIIRKNVEYESNIDDNDSHVLEMLSNMDKIVYRGQTQQELVTLKQITNETIDKSNDFYIYANMNETFLTFMMYVIIAVFLFYNIERVKNNKIEKLVFITFITIIMLYKDKIGVLIWQITNIIEFYGRVQGVLNKYNDSILLKKVVDKNSDEYHHNKKHYDYLFSNDNYKPITLPFNKITFKNVSFKYRTKDVYVFKNLNMELFLTDKIIGFTGKSGRGKTTLMKLVMKMYNEYEGDIFIDDVNIKGIDPDYLRKNIIYINQNSKLFDKSIIENIMYGCVHTPTCDNNLKQIIENYPKIRSLFESNDIYTTRVGPLGEKMSGGQRMVISILTGLISPSSCGLVLDEPTTGLDPELKKEIIDLIRENRNNKKFIIIISHDKDIYRIFDEKKEI